MNHITKDSPICYLDAAYNPSFFYKINPWSHKFYGKDRPYSYALIKDCILNFDKSL